MRPVIFALVLLVFSSCSGFFDQNQADKNGTSIAPLAVSGGGYLSTEEFNEITPFIFRDPNSGKAYLFFSSDKSGNYDIYYAEMYEDGTFANPVRMTNAINTTNTEISPIVYQYVLNNVTPKTNSFISYISITSNGSATNIVTWRMVNNFIVTNRDDSFAFNAKRIGYFFDKSDLILKGELLLCDSSSNVSLYKKGNMNSDFLWWGYDGVADRNQTNVLRVGDATSAANGFYDTYFNSYRYIFQKTNHQFFGGNIFSLTILVTNTNFFDIPFYASPYRDRDPFVDSGDEMRKVYFASDRYGKGNFDLYRYNYMTYWAVGAY